jgi:hypothetical protein
MQVVESVGCLTEASGGVWLLTNATEPVPSKTAWTSEAALKEAATKPAGKQRFRLVGVDVFTPTQVKDRRVAVKGVLVPAADNRINVTSLQPVGACKP